MKKLQLNRVSSWDPDGICWKKEKSLAEALMPGTVLPRLISLVGGGGKTTTMYQLAAELAGQGKRVLVTTTTHIRCPDEGSFQTAKISHVRELENLAWEGRILTAGTPVETTVPGCEKLTMPKGLEDPEHLAWLFTIADVILVEADGAKQLPVKIPEDWEPVLLPQTGMVIACAGLRAIGQTFEKACFRFGSKGAWLHRDARDVIEPEDLALILMDERGSHRQVRGRYYRMILNQADDARLVKLGEEVLRALPVTMQPGCVMTAYQQEKTEGNY